MSVCGHVGFRERESWRGLVSCWCSLLLLPLHEHMDACTQVCVHFKHRMQHDTHETGVAGVEELEMMGECCGVLVRGMSARDSEEANFRRVVSVPCPESRLLSAAYVRGHADHARNIRRLYIPYKLFQAMQVINCYLGVDDMLACLQLSGVLRPPAEEEGLPMGLVLVGLGGEREEGGGSWLCAAAYCEEKVCTSDHVCVNDMTGVYVFPCMRACVREAEASYHGLACANYALGLIMLRRDL